MTKFRETKCFGNTIRTNLSRFRLILIGSLKGRILVGLILLELREVGPHLSLLVVRFFVYSEVGRCAAIRFQSREEIHLRDVAVFGRLLFFEG